VDPHFLCCRFAFFPPYDLSGETFPSVFSGAPWSLLTHSSGRPACCFIIPLPMRGAYWLFQNTYFIGDFFSEGRRVFFCREDFSSPQIWHSQTGGSFHLPWTKQPPPHSSQASSKVFVPRAPLCHGLVSPVFSLAGCQSLHFFFPPPPFARKPQKRAFFPHTSISLFFSQQCGANTKTVSSDVILQMLRSIPFFEQR